MMAMTMARTIAILSTYLPISARRRLPTLPTWSLLLACTALASPSSFIPFAHFSPAAFEPARAPPSTSRTSTSNVGSRIVVVRELVEKFGKQRGARSASGSPDY